MDYPYLSSSFKGQNSGRKSRRREVKEMEEIEKEKAKNELPFILEFLEERKGVSSPTTSGTWDDIDSADRA